MQRISRVLRCTANNFSSNVHKSMSWKSKALLSSGGVFCLGGFLYDAAQDFKNTSKMISLADDVFDRFLDKVFPGKPEPWLLDLETMKYPEFIPTLVLDLDKVLVHMEHDRLQGWRVIRRPGADKFLKELQHYYELVIFSDDVFPVAVDVIQKWGVSCTGVLHRDFCKKAKMGEDRGYAKDLSKLGRNLDKVILVDHEKIAGKFQKDNLINIKPFEGDESDRELYDLLDFLKAAATSRDDVRKFIKEHGGGDENIGRRFLIIKKEMDGKIQSRRAFGRAFVGAPGVMGPKKTW